MAYCIFHENKEEVVIEKIWNVKCSFNNNKKKMMFYDLFSNIPVYSVFQKTHYFFSNIHITNKLRVLLFLYFSRIFYYFVFHILSMEYFKKSKSSALFFVFVPSKV